MSGWDKDFDLGLRGFAIAAGVAAIAVLAWTVLLASRVRKEPSRCAAGLQQRGARCCAPGQGLSLGHCVGEPRSCPSGMERVDSPEPGCAWPAERVSLAGGSVMLGPTDWDSVNVVERHIVAVQAFSIDQTEVTVHRYQDCVRAGLCAALVEQTEPGLPVTAVSVEQAEAFCAFVGGRLPTPHEWVFAAAGTDARRFPFGAHGLVCRRASYGLVHGPCAEGGTSPELAGARPEGQTPEGIHDLAGNVAELARTGNGSSSVHGGSFLSQRAGELKTWSVGPAQKSAAVGFRCAYDSR